MPTPTPFVGTVENTTSSPLTRTRVEVHLDNGTELGPTTPVDLQPGEVLPLNLPSTQAPFQIWTAHPEVGSSEGGHGGTEGVGGEGMGEGGSAAGTTTLTSTGISRGVHTSQTLAPGQGYAGKLNDLEVAVSYDAATDTFVGRVKNEANEGLCDTRLAVNLDGQTGPETVRIPALDLRGRADSVMAAGPGSFSIWNVEADTFTCTTVTSDGGEGGSETGGGESGGGEGSNEGSGEGAGHEGGGSEGGAEGGAEGQQESATIPVTQTARGQFDGRGLRSPAARARPPPRGDRDGSVRHRLPARLLMTDGSRARPARTDPP